MNFFGLLLRFMKVVLEIVGGSWIFGLGGYVAGLGHQSNCGSLKAILDHSRPPF